jgi:8-oxo-dGTP diphosphatase
MDNTRKSDAPAPSRKASKEEEAFLLSYKRRDYDSPLATVDMAIFSIHHSKLHVLLIERRDFPARHLWALPGGFIDLSNDADLNQTAHRKLFEKTGLRSPYLEQVETIGNAERDPRGWSLTVLHFALVDYQAVILGKDSSKQRDAKRSDGTELISERAEWVPVELALKKKLAFDHSLLLVKALARLRNKTRYTALPIRLMTAEFTLGDLQKVFEIVLGRALEKKSFRRRVLEAGLLEESGEMQASGRRPAALYRVRELEDGFVFPRLLS